MRYGPYTIAGNSEAQPQNHIWLTDLLWLVYLVYFFFFLIRTIYLYLEIGGFHRSILTDVLGKREDLDTLGTLLLGSNWLEWRQQLPLNSLHAPVSQGP